jgi:hypothetical protein
MECEEPAIQLAINKNAKKKKFNSSKKSEQVSNLSLESLKCDSQICVNAITSKIRKG